MHMQSKLGQNVSDFAFIFFVYKQFDGKIKILSFWLILIKLYKSYNAVVPIVMGIFEFFLVYVLYRKCSNSYIQV